MTFDYNCTVYAINAAARNNDFVNYLSTQFNISASRIKIQGYQCGSTILMFTIDPPASPATASASDAASVIAAEIVAAVQSKTFTVQTLGNATAVSSPVILCANGAVAPNNTASNCPIPTTPPLILSSDSSSLDGGGIAGVVVGCVVFAALVLGGGYYIYTKKTPEETSTSTTPGKYATTPKKGEKRVEEVELTIDAAKTVPTTPAVSPKVDTSTPVPSPGASTWPSSDTSAPNTASAAASAAATAAASRGGAGGVSSPLRRNLTAAEGKAFFEAKDNSGRDRDGSIHTVVIHLG